MFMHSRNVLHLDLHSSNVLASSDSAEIIDFGKTTLIKFPINFRLDMNDRAEYNEKHKQIEDELRNQRGSQTSITFTAWVGLLDILQKNFAYLVL